MSTIIQVFMDKTLHIRKLLLRIFHFFSALARLSLQLILLDFCPRQAPPAVKNRLKHITPNTLLLYAHFTLT